VYPISVAAELSGVDPQSLRLYEQRGLVAPARTVGGTRRYSSDDLAVVRQISELVGQGVNLAGVARILALQSRNLELESANAWLRTTTGVGPQGNGSATTLSGERKKDTR
jgi:MerR family transcriptional regulator/heat shock protein HspR